MGGDGALGGSNMAPFLTKLFQIVSNPQTDQAIIWTPKGDSFVITDPDTFARDILPTYFKHNNIRSFIRQLNTYGFRKRTNISSSDEHLEFFHEKFRRDEPALLVQIKRCHQPKPSASAPGGGGGGGGGGMGESVLGEGKTPQDLDTIRGRVSELKNRLGTLQVRPRLARLSVCAWGSGRGHVGSLRRADPGGASSDGPTRRQPSRPIPLQPLSPARPPSRLRRRSATTTSRWSRR